MKTIEFKDKEADLATLGDVCRELEAAGLTPQQAAAQVLSQMATQAMQKGADVKEVMDALFVVINQNQETGKEEPVLQRRRNPGLTEEQANAIREEVKFLQNFLLYWDMIICSEIQRMAYHVKDKLKQQGMYRHQMKRCTNALTDEARKLQIRIKDNDRAVVIKWCRRMDKQELYSRPFVDNGGSIVNYFNLSYLKKFYKLWEVVRLDCRTTAKTLSREQSGLVSSLLELEALTNTGIELFDTCVKKMKKLVEGHGKASITKSTHHESMRNTVHNLLRNLGKASSEVPETVMKYARQHLADYQLSIVEEGSGDFFQNQFDLLSEEFLYYILASMRIKMECGELGVGDMKTAWYRLGTKHRVRKFFKELASIKMPGKDADIRDVSVAISSHDWDRTEVARFKRLCLKDERHEQPESEMKQLYRTLRILARRNNFMLSDDTLRVMIMKHKTKKALMKVLSEAGFELKQTLRKVRGMKINELKQI